MHLGCPGATTVTVLEGGGKCPYPEGSQLQAAEAFLRTHPTTVLVTVDLGFNDLLPCLRHEVVDAPCVDGALATVHDQLGQILAGIKAAAPPGAVIVGVGHYDPYLGDYLEGPGGAGLRGREPRRDGAARRHPAGGLRRGRGAHGRRRVGLRPRGP